MVQILYFINKVRDLEKLFALPGSYTSIECKTFGEYYSGTSLAENPLYTVVRKALRYVVTV